MCWSYNRQYDTNFLAVMPTNLYGPGDNYDLATSHVIPALIRKTHEAKMRLSLEIENLERLSKLLTRINELPNVHEARRITE